VLSQHVAEARPDPLQPAGSAARGVLRGLLPVECVHRAALTRADVHGCAVA